MSSSYNVLSFIEGMLICWSWAIATAPVKTTKRHANDRAHLRSFISLPLDLSSLALPQPTTLHRPKQSRCAAVKRQSAMSDRPVQLQRVRFNTGQVELGVLP